MLFIPLMKNFFMKKTCTLFVSMIIVMITARAQIQQGNVLVGGDIANFNLDLDNGGYFRASLNPKAAWFIRDNFAVGAFLSFGIVTANNQGTGVSYGVGPLARYYFSGKSAELLRHTRFFLEGTVGINGDNPAQGSNTNGLGLGIGPGVAYFITSNIGLEFLLKYDGIVGFGSSPTSNNLNLGVGFQIYLPSSRVKQIVNDAGNR
jgi:hypothetical protein